LGGIERYMSDAISKITYGLSWIAVFLAIIATVLWFGIVTNPDGWSGLGFMFMVAPIVGGISLLFGVIPSAILYFQKRQRRDLLSLRMSGCSCLLVVGETAALFIL
jgi:hypothetical protein